MKEEDRHIFDAWLVLQRKAPITAAGIDHTGARLFVGLEDGLLEEYSLLPHGGGIQASLTARKPITLKVPIVDVLPATPSNCLVVHTADGGLRLLHSDTFEGRVVCKAGVLAASVDLPQDAPPRLAVLTRTSKRSVRFSAYELLPAGGQVAMSRTLWEVDVPDSASSHSLAWAGPSLVCGSGCRYVLVAGKGGGGGWRELLTVPGPDSPARPAPAVQSLPLLGRALLMMGPVGVIVDAAGEPVGNPLQLEGLPPVGGLGTGCGFVLAACEDGIHVFDPTQGVQVQSVKYGASEAPGQPLRVASGGSATSSCTLVVAGRHKAWVLVPRPPAERARELLQRRDYGAGLQLAHEGAGRGEPWAYEALAQAALMLLTDCRFDQAVEALDCCTPAALQPWELFPLFPGYTARWQPYPRPAHWGLHPALEPLDVLVARAVAAGPARHAAASNGGGGGCSREAVVREGRQMVMHYLFRARVLGGVEHLDGVDTLLFHMLLDLGAAEEATAFAAVPNQADIDLLLPRLQQAGWHHALAMLWAARGAATAALEVWRRIAGGEIALGPPESSAAQQQEALISAAALLKDQTACTDTAVLSCVPWLLEASQKAALDVLSARELVPADVLPMLPPDSDARWRYLSHLAVQGRSSDPAIHTELAKALVAAIFRAAPQLRHAEAAAPVRPRRTVPPLVAAHLAGSRAPFSVAALVSGGSAPVPEGAGSLVDSLRLQLRLHLEQSPLWDRAVVASCLAGCALFEEAAVMHAAVHDHVAALRVLALTLRDVGAAEAYAAALLPPSEHHLLLQLVLNPGGGAAPRWDDASHVVTALGGTLNPLDVVQELPPEMPLDVAVRVVTPMLQERVHRRRQSQVVAALHRARVAASAVGRVQVEAGRVTVEESRACLDCHLRLGGKVFVVLPPEDGRQQERGDGGNAEPAAVCFNCWHRRTGTAGGLALTAPVSAVCPSGDDGNEPLSPHTNNIDAV